MIVYPTKVRGETRYVVDYGYPAGKRRRDYYRTQEEANGVMEKAQKATVLAGKWWAAVRTDEKMEMIAVFKQMRDAGVTPADVWEAYSSGELAVAKQRRTLRESIAETILAKREAGRKKRYVDELEKYLNRFALQREDIPIDRIGPADIDKWFATRKESGETRKSNLGRLSSMFGLCHRRGYIPSNPCKSAESVSLDNKPPEIFHVEQLSKALKVCQRVAPAFFRPLVLGGLIGLRPEEAVALDPKNIDLKKKRLTVDFHSSKIRSWRIIELWPSAVMWLKRSDEVYRNAILSNAMARRARRKLRDGLRMPKWPQDVLRHSAASHLLAFHDGDEAKVAAILGTSPRELHRRYKNGMVTKEDGKKFMGLKPS